MSEDNGAQQAGGQAMNQAPSGLGHSVAIPSAARIERLAINLRSYAYAMGAPRTDNDEERALTAARQILPIVDIQK